MGVRCAVLHQPTKNPKVSNERIGSDDSAMISTIDATSSTSAASAASDQSTSAGNSNGASRNTHKFGGAQAGSFQKKTTPVHQADLELGISPLPSSQFTVRANSGSARKGGAISTPMGGRLSISASGRLTSSAADTSV